MNSPLSLRLLKLLFSRSKLLTPSCPCPVGQVNSSHESEAPWWSISKILPSLFGWWLFWLSAGWACWKCLQETGNFKLCIFICAKPQLCRQLLKAKVRCSNCPPKGGCMRPSGQLGRSFQKSSCGKMKMTCVSWGAAGLIRTVLGMFGVPRRRVNWEGPKTNTLSHLTLLLLHCCCCCWSCYFCCCCCMAHCQCLTRYTK